MVTWLIKAINVVLIFIGVATILEIWSIRIGPIIAGLDLFGVALALGAQDLFKNLEPLLGAEYFSSFPSDAFLSTDVDLSPEQLSVIAESMVPAVEHNPIIVFHLRPGVRFHDGHVFDAGDVKFTYEAIMNPKNLSPRVAD